MAKTQSFGDPKNSEFETQSLEFETLSLEFETQSFLKFTFLHAHFDERYAHPAAHRGRGSNPNAKAAEM